MEAGELMVGELSQVRTAPKSIDRLLTPPDGWLSRLSKPDYVDEFLSSSLMPLVLPNRWLSTWTAMGRGRCPILSFCELSTRTLISDLALLLSAPWFSRLVHVTGAYDFVLFYRELDLQLPIFQKTAAYGHFGRKEFSWEKPRLLRIYPRDELDN